jgi:hypothetical protein
MKLPAHRRIELIAVLGVALALSACSAVPSGRFAALADGTRSIATNSVATYGGVVDLQRTYMLYNPNGDKLNEESFKPVIRDEDGTVRSFDFKPRLEFRSAALEVLADYADALHAFATKNYQEDLDAATQSLGASVANLAAYADAGSAAQAGGVLATAINGMGTAATEYLRRKTLRTAMDTAQPGVDTLAKLIATDNKSIEVAVLTMRRGILRKADRLRPSTGIARISFDSSVATIISDSDETLTQLELMNAAVTKIPIAHAEIRQSLDQRADSMTALKGLIAEAKRLNRYYHTTAKSYERK